MKLKENKNASTLTFKLEKFEGPLDLLLHLIKQNKMDIFDIPIATITAQYIDYLHQMQELKLDVAGEYLIMAAMLLNIKSKMLLPHSSKNEVIEDSTDPREELVHQLVLHQTFQRATINLQLLAQRRQQSYARPEAVVPKDVHLGKLNKDNFSLTKIQEAFIQVLNRHKISQPLKRKVETERYNIKDEIIRIRKCLENNKTLQFEELFGEQIDIEELVTTFLAVLELTKHGEIKVIQKVQLGPITLKEKK